MTIVTDQPIQSTQPSALGNLPLMVTHAPGDFQRFNVVLIFAATTMNLTVKIYDNAGNLRSNTNYTQPIQINLGNVDYQKITWSDPSGSYNVFVTTQTIHYDDQSQWEQAASSVDYKAPPASFVQVNGTATVDITSQQAGLAQDVTFKNSSKYSEINQSITQGQNIF